MNGTGTRVKDTGLKTKGDWTKRKKRLGRFDGSNSTRGMQRLLRWPIMLGVLIYSLILLWMYTLTRGTVALYEATTIILYRKRRRLVNLMQEASSYEEWAEYALELDEFDGSDVWKGRPESNLYDHTTVQSLLSRLSFGIERFERGEAGYASDMIDTLQRIYSSNLSGLGIDNEAIYAETHCGTKDLIEELVDKVVLATEVVRKAPKTEITNAAKIAFFERALRSYGQMAVCLSSGAMMANYHFGTVKSLLDQDLLPNVIAGTSGGITAPPFLTPEGASRTGRICGQAQPLTDVLLHFSSLTWSVSFAGSSCRSIGSFVAAYLCTRDDQTLRATLNAGTLHKLVRLFDESPMKLLVRYIVYGEMIHTNGAVERLRNIFGDMTFEEAYLKTGRVLCITASSKEKFGESILLNHITAPHVSQYTSILHSTPSSDDMGQKPLRAVKKIRAFSYTHSLLRRAVDDLECNHRIISGTARAAADATVREEPNHRRGCTIHRLWRQLDGRRFQERCTSEKSFGDFQRQLPRGVTGTHKKQAPEVIDQTEGVVQKRANLVESGVLVRPFSFF